MEIVKDKTISVTRMTGKGTKDITREDFIKVWVDHAGLYALVDYTDMVNMQCWVDEIKAEITELAGHSWDLQLKRKETALAYLNREKKNVYI